MPRVAPCLWFDTQGLEAAEFYTSIFPNSRIHDVSHYGEAGPREAGMVMLVTFELDGQAFTALNGGPDFHFNEAISFFVDCRDQDEIDYYWSRLSEGGEEGPCGWLKDRYGVSWQIAPMTLMDELFTSPDAARAERAMRAMLAMGKLDVAALRAAADGVAAPAGGA